MTKYELFKLDNFDESFENMILYQKKKTNMIYGLTNAHGNIHKAPPIETDRMQSLLLDLAIELGLSPNGLAPMKKVELVAPNFPDHLFRIGLAIDSGNPFGLDSAMISNKLPCLNDIFNGKTYKIDDVSYIKVKWGTAFDFAVDARNGFDKTIYVNNNIKYCDIALKVRPGDTGVALAGDAVEWTKSRSLGKMTSSRFGYHFGDNLMTARSLICGKDGCVYLVCRRGAQWYLDALSIVRQTIETALSDRGTSTYIIRKSNEK